MVARAGLLASRCCQPRQARKGAAVAADTSAGVRLVRVASNAIVFKIQGNDIHQ